MLQNGQRKGCGLTRACLRDAEKILPGEQQRNSLGLNRRRHTIIPRRKCTTKRLDKAQLRKMFGGHYSKSLCAGRHAWRPRGVVNRVPRASGNDGKVV